VPTEYWLVNLATKEYTKVVDNGEFFDVDDWKTQTPFADANYIDLSMQKVWPDQKVNDHMFWGNDLCSAGMIVGVYFDKSHVTRAEAEAFLADLRVKQDVAQAYIHALSFVPFEGPGMVEDAEVEALIADIPLKGFEFDWTHAYEESWDDVRRRLAASGVPAEKIEESLGESLTTGPKSFYIDGEVIPEGEGWGPIPKTAEDAVDAAEAYQGTVKSAIAKTADYAEQAVGHLCMGDFDTALENLKAAAAEESEFGDAPTFRPLVERLEAIMAKQKPSPGPRM
jgi:hypothetical protein